MPGFVYRPEFTLHEGRFRYIMVVKMPGVTKENVNLFITNGVLTIEGATVGKIKDNFSVWKYKRELSVPNDVDVRNISAAMEDGVLTLKVYKKPVKKVITVR
ncbi:HSP20-like chaperone [Cladochytrium replicatum]|nr:HSP20-like chaperone [Cladochytrium replicatum]